MGKYSVIGSNIKKYRMNNSMTQRELGEKIHKKEITVRKYESGDVKVPFSSLLDICRTFNIKPSKLFECEDIYLSDKLSSLYPEFDDDVDRYLYDPNSYEFISKFKEGNGDSDSLFNSLILYFAKKNKINIDLGDFTMYDEFLLFDLVESLVTTYLKNIKYRNYDNKNNED